MGVARGRSARVRAAAPGRRAGHAGCVRGSVAHAAGQRGAARGAGRARSNAGAHPRSRRARLPATSTGTGRKRPRRCTCARRRSGREARRGAAVPRSAPSFRRTSASPTRLWGRWCEKRRSQIPGATMLRRCTGRVQFFFQIKVFRHLDRARPYPGGPKNDQNPFSSRDTYLARYLETQKPPFVSSTRACCVVGVECLRCVRDVVHLACFRGGGGFCPHSRRVFCVV